MRCLKCGNTITDSKCVCGFDYTQGNYVTVFPCCAYKIGQEMSAEASESQKLIDIQSTHNTNSYLEAINIQAADVFAIMDNVCGAIEKESMTSEESLRELNKLSAMLETNHFNVRERLKEVISEPVNALNAALSNIEKPSIKATYEKMAMLKAEEISALVNLDGEFVRQESRVYELKKKKMNEMLSRANSRWNSERANGTLSGLIIRDGKVIEYNGSEKQIVIPEDVFLIGERAFENSSVEHIILPDNLIIIEERAFSHSQLEAITLPSSLRVIYNEAFAFCHKLKEIRLPDSVLKIAERAFLCSAIERVSLPKTLRELGDFIFCTCDQLQSIVLPSSLKKIGKAFVNCSALKQVEFTSVHCEISPSAFAHCDKISHIFVPQGFDIDQLPVELRGCVQIKR